MTDSYSTISKGSVFTLKKKRSQFIAECAGTDTLSEAKAFIERISRKNQDAAHNCWAYRVGYPDWVQHCSDDGEPSGTAGRPILGCIERASLYDVAVVVTRYFGGVKLGKRGLIEAYSAAASGAFRNSIAAVKTLTVSFSFETTYDRYKDSLRRLGDLKLKDDWIKTIFSEKVASEITVPASSAEEASKILEDLKAQSLIGRWDRL